MSNQSEITRYFRVLPRQATSQSFRPCELLLRRNEHDFEFLDHHSLAFRSLVQSTHAAYPLLIINATDMTVLTSIFRWPNSPESLNLSRDEQYQHGGRDRTGETPNTETCIRHLSVVASGHL